MRIQSLLRVAYVDLIAGSEVDSRTGDGQTSLHLAARANSAPMCELLVKHGANPTNFASSAGGHSVLHAAARDGAFECAQMLLQCGVDPNSRTTVSSIFSPSIHIHILCNLGQFRFDKNGVLLKSDIEMWPFFYQNRFLDIDRMVNLDHELRGFF